MEPEIVEDENEDVENLKPLENPPALREQQVIEQLMNQAVVNGNIEVLERLVVVRDKLKAQHAEEEFNISMSAFQAECPIIRKTREVRSRDGQLLYKYAPLESIVAQVKGLLFKHGFSYTIETQTLEASVRVTCIAKHNLGHAETSSYTAPYWKATNAMNDTQVVGAALTYAKRNAFCNSFGILTGEDDTDGGVTTEPKITDAQITKIRDLLPQTTFNEGEILKRGNVSLITQLSSAQANSLITFLERAIQKRKREDVS